MRVKPPRVGDWLVGHVRARALTDLEIAVTVDVSEPPDLKMPVRVPLIIIRDDSGPLLELGTYQRSIGASVLAGSRLKDQPAKDIADWLASVLFDDDIVLPADSPIARVDTDGCNGPYAIQDPLDVTRMYLTAQYVAVGSL